MKRLILLCILAGISGLCFSQDPRKKVTPDELAEVVVDVLEELRLTLPEHDLEFTAAELEVSAKKSFAAGAEINVWIFKAELEGERETNVKITYSLGKLLEKAQQESTMLAFAMKSSVNTSVRDSNLKIKSFNEMKSLPIDNSALPEFEKAQTFDQMASYVEKVNTRRGRAKRLKNAKEVLVESIQKTLQDYSRISKDFKDVKFDVCITFSVDFVGEAGIDLGLFGATGGGGKGWEQSLKLSFGKKETK